MDAHEDTRRIQVLAVSDPGRRRRWADSEKIRIVEESYRGGSTTADVARRHEITRSMLYDWRYRHRLGLPGGGPRFPQLIAADEGSGAGRPDPVPPPPPPPPPSAMMIEADDRCRITLPADFDMDAAARLIKDMADQRSGGAPVIAFPAGVKVWIADGVTDLRCGMNRLALEVHEGLGRDPHGGEIFVFAAGRAHGSRYSGMMVSACRFI